MRCVTCQGRPLAQAAELYERRTIPAPVTKATLKQYRGSSAITEILRFPDRGHSLTIDHGRREVADACLTWLTGNDL